MIGLVMEARDKALENLAYAQEIRVRRARTRVRIHDGELSAQQVVLNPPEEMQSASLSYVLRSVHGVGETRIREVCKGADLSDSRRLSDLTERQRSAVVEQMAKWSCFGRIDG